MMVASRVFILMMALLCFPPTSSSPAVADRSSSNGSAAGAEEGSALVDLWIGGGWVSLPSPPRRRRTRSSPEAGGSPGWNGGGGEGDVGGGVGGSDGEGRGMEDFSNVWIRIPLRDLEEEGMAVVAMLPPRLRRAWCTGGFASISITVDGAQVCECADGCKGKCRCNAKVSEGHHMVSAMARDGEGVVASSREMLVQVQGDDREEEGGEEGGVGGDESKAREILEEYSDLHRRILDVDDESVEKRFLIIRSSHGISNTQIEEVTGLLVAMETRRALILDFSNDTYTGPRPALEYDWPLDILVDGALPFLRDVGEEEEEGGDWTRETGIVQVPRMPMEEYGKYGNFLACSQWNESLGGDAAIAHTFFGLPSAYLNKHHTGPGSILSVLGPKAFPVLHRFLHRPSLGVLERMENALAAIQASACSVGLQVRWHHLRQFYEPDGGDRRDPRWGAAHQRVAVSKFVSCAARACPFDSKTAYFLASDFGLIRGVLRRELIDAAVSNWEAKSVDLSRTCGHQGGRGACHKWQYDDRGGFGVDLGREREVGGGRMLVQAVEDGSEIGFEMWVSGTRDFARGQGNEKVGEGVRCEAAPGGAVASHYRASGELEGVLMTCGEGGRGTSGRFIHVIAWVGAGEEISVDFRVYPPSPVTRQIFDGEFPRIVVLDGGDSNRASGDSAKCREVWGEDATCGRGDDDGEVMMDNGDHEAALADQRLLSECQSIITTRESTLGFVAHASADKPFWQVSPDEDECEWIDDGQAGLYMDRIHDEWPWSGSKFKELECWDEAQERAEGRSKDILRPV